VSDLVAAARAGKLDPVYIVSSEHPVLIDRLLQAVRDVAVPPAMRAWNYDVLEGKITASRVITTAQTLPMMGPTRMVFVRDLAVSAAEELTGLIPYLDAPSPSTVLFMITSKLDKRFKLYASAGKKGWLHVLEAPRNAEPWIRAEAQARGVKLAPQAISRLADAVGNDLSRLALCIDQLGLYAGSETVSGDDVDDLVADTRERSVFELTDAIGAGDLPRALVAVASLVDQRQSSIGVLAMLARAVRQIALIHVARAEGVSKYDLPSRIGAPPFVVDKLIPQSRRYTPEALARATQLIATADWALKGFPEPAATGLASDAVATGAAQKTLGRQLGERLVLERLAAAIIRSAVN
jgi:DNA polymerase III subunit delta